MPESKALDFPPLKGTTRLTKRIQDNSDVAFSGMGIGMVLSSIIVGVVTKVTDAPFIAILCSLLLSSVIGGYLGMMFGSGLSVGRQLRHELGSFHSDAKNLSSWDTWKMVLSLRNKKTVLTYVSGEGNRKKQAVVSSGWKGTSVELISLPSQLELWDLSAGAVTQAYGLSTGNKVST